MKKIKDSKEEILNQILEILEIKQEELKIIKSKKNYLIKKICEMKEENIQLKSNIFQLQEENLIKTKENFSLNQKLFDLLNNNIYDKKNSTNLIEVLKNQIENKDYSIELQKFNIESKNEAIQMVKIDNTLINNENKQLKIENEKFKFEIDKYKSRIFELENKLDNIYMERKSESSLIIENEHLKYDNLRLLNILKSTKEYKNFGYLTDDNITKAIIYIKTYPTLQKDSKGLNVKEKIEKNKIHNNLNWISLSTYTKVKELLNYHKIEFNEDCINEILYLLNSSWKERENNLLLFVENKYKKEIEEIKRKYNYIDSSKVKKVK